jgi:hypothetical protein
MKRCPYCGHSNVEHAKECRKCEASLVSSPGRTYVPPVHLFGSVRARDVRSKALAMVALGLLMKVYWGGYGPWPVLDTPPLAGIRPWLEPVLIYGGIVLYAVGWLLNWI